MMPSSTPAPPTPSPLCGSHLRTFSVLSTLSSSTPISGTAAMNMKPTSIKPATHSRAWNREASTILKCAPLRTWIKVKKLWLRGGQVSLLPENRNYEYKYYKCFIKLENDPSFFQSQNLDQCIIFILIVDLRCCLFTKKKQKCLKQSRNHQNKQSLIITKHTHNHFFMNIVKQLQ